MPITINSPYSGRPVKIRDQDIGRAVRDEEQRVFYVVPRSVGEGYYAAITRQGSPKDEQRYDAMQTKMDTTQQQVVAQADAVHDATGRRKANPLARLMVMILLAAALVVAGYAAYVQWGGGQWPDFFEEPATPVSLAPAGNRASLPPIIIVLAPGPNALLLDVLL